MCACPVKAETVIDSPAERLWEILEDVHGYGQWSKIFWFARARLQLGGGALLVARAKPLLPPLLIPVRFEVIEPNRELRWGGGVAGVATGSHYLQLEPVSSDRTRVIHGEDFDGLAVRAAWPVMGRLLPQAYERFLDELAVRASS